MAQDDVPFYQKIPVVGKHLVSNSIYGLYTANGFEKSFQQMLKDTPYTTVGLGKDHKLSKDAFDKVVSGKAKDFSVFAKIKVTDDEDFAAKLKACTNAATVTAIKASIATALTPPQAFKDAQAEYTAAVDYLQKSPKAHGRKAGDLLGLMARTKTNAIKAIKEQHKVEKEKLIAELAVANPGNPPAVPATPEGALRTQLQTGKPGGPGFTHDEITAYKDKMVKELETSQSKQLTEFTKTVDADNQKLHKAAQMQNRNLMLVYNLYLNNPKMKDIIEKHARKVPVDPNARSKIVFNGTTSQFDFTGVKVSQLGDLESRTGRKIKRNDDGSYSMPIGGFLGGFTDSLDPRQSIKSDMLLVAQAIRAENEEITLEISGYEGNEELAMQRGREAYEAAIEAGFEPKNIAIKVNGVLYTNTKDIPKKDKDRHKKIDADLFGTHRNTFAELDRKAPDIKKEYDRISKVQAGPSEVTQNAMKAEITQFKAGAAQRALEETAAAAKAAAEAEAAAEGAAPAA